MDLGFSTPAVSTYGTSGFLTFGGAGGGGFTLSLEAFSSLDSIFWGGGIGGLVESFFFSGTGGGSSISGTNGAAETSSEDDGGGGNSISGTNAFSFTCSCSGGEAMTGGGLLISGSLGCSCFPPVSSTDSRRRVILGLACSASCAGGESLVSFFSSTSAELASSAGEGFFKERRILGLFSVEPDSVLSGELA